MIKNDAASNKRIEMLVKVFIETEMLTFTKKGYGYMKKYFRYLHLGNRIINKIKATKQGAFILISKESDIKITLVKGNITKVTSEVAITIVNNEVCFKNS